MAVILLDPPHPWLLPLLLLLVLLEVGAALGKRQWCQALAKEVKELTIRKVEVMLQMNKVGACLRPHPRLQNQSMSARPQCCIGLTRRAFRLSPIPHVQLGIPTDFVKKSKLERELIQLDKDLAPRKERLAKQATDYEGMVRKARVRRESQKHA